MKKYFLLITLLLLCAAGWAQSNTTVELGKKYTSSLSMYFYKNTLKMFNQNDDKSIDELIKDIEKMRFLVIDKIKQKFTNEELKNLMKSYRNENYETVISSRLDGRKFEVVVKEVGNRVKGTILVVSDSSNLYILDIVGRIAIDKAGSLFNAIDGNSDIGKKVRDYMTNDNNGKKDKKAGIHID